MIRLVFILSFLVACSHAGHGSNLHDASADATSDASTGDGATTPGDGSPHACGSTEICDGVIDDDCDGVVDEGCGRCPLLSETCPTGCCQVPNLQLAMMGATAPSIVVDDAGDIYVMYTDESAGWHADLAAYDAVLGTWSSRDLGPTGTHRNKLALDHQGRLHMLHGFDEGHLIYERSDDHGATSAVTSIVGTLAIGGVFDMALDSTDSPHVVYDAMVDSDVFSQLTYATFDGETWHSTKLDLTTRCSQYPSLAIGFADRPHIVTEAYHPDGVDGTSKRYIYFDGNQWRYENIDLETSGSFATISDPYFSAQSLALDANDNATVAYTLEASGGAKSLVVATRPSGAAQSWTTTPVAGATSFANPSLVTDPAGGLFAVTDGVDLQRGHAWQSSAIGQSGDHPAAFRRGNYLYVVYLANPPGGAMGSLQLAVVPLD